MKTWDYIERVRSLPKLREEWGELTDYRIAKLLGVAQPTIAGYRAGRREADDETAAKIAVLLGYPREGVVADIRYERAKAEGNSAMASVWQSILAAFPVASPIVVKMPARAQAGALASAADASIIAAAPGLSGGTGRRSGLKIRRGNPS